MSIYNFFSGNQMEAKLLLKNTNTNPHLAYQTAVQALTSIHHWMFYHSVKANQYCHKALLSVL